MTYIESVAQGAAANRRSAHKNPVTLLRELREADRTGSMAKVLARWKAKVAADSEFLDAALVYAGTNYWHTLDRDEKAEQARNRSRQSPDQRREANRKIDALVEQVKGMVLMDLILPNGKRLGDATFGECRAAGGWFAQLASKGKPQQIVRQVLTEPDLHALRFGR